MIEKIIGGVAALLALYLIYVLLKYFKFFDNVHLSGLEKTSAIYEITSSKWASSGIASPNYTLSIWFYVSSWEGGTQHGYDKHIFSRNFNDTNADVEAYLGANTNDLTVKFLGADDLATSCVVNNVPLQKWVHLAVAKYNNVMDIYIDGKLAKTCAGGDSGSTTPRLNSIILHGDHSENNNSFDGYTTNVKYTNTTMNPVEIYNIYKNGYGGSWLDSLLGGYAMRMSVLKNDQEIAGVGLG